MYHYTECGLDNDHLKNGFVVLDGPEYGKCVSAFNRDGLHKFIGEIIIKRPALLPGTKVRFLRKRLNLSQSAVGFLFGVKELTIARWKKSRTHISRTSDAGLRVLFTEHYNSDGNVKRMLERLAELDKKTQRIKAPKTIIELDESKEEKWKLAA